ncbi:MAG: cysteine dioxygenase [Blastocatellia bacterium]
MSGKHLIGIDDFITRLRAYENATITRDGILDFCSGVQLSDSSLAPYVRFGTGHYTRNLIYRDDLFEVMTICWLPGQKTAVHTHNGQLCWMIAQRGNLALVDYKWLGCDHPELQNVVGLDCLAGSEHIRLEQLREVTASPGGPVLTADKLQTIHRISNLDEPAVSVHIYSRPIDSCVAFDMQNQRCYRRKLAYFSLYGEIAPDATPAQTPAFVQLS